LGAVGRLGHWAFVVAAEDPMCTDGGRDEELPRALLPGIEVEGEGLRFIASPTTSRLGQRAELAADICAALQ